MADATLGRVVLYHWYKALLQYTLELPARIALAGYADRHVPMGSRRRVGEDWKFWKKGELHAALNQHAGRYYTVQESVLLVIIIAWKRIIAE